jgi:hypothetical protein
MQYEESAVLGERLLNQALRALQVDPSEIGEGHWERLLKENAGKTRQAILADIGLGKRLNVVVATQLLSGKEGAGGERKPAKMGAVTIRGTEGMAVQLAKCCRPIPGDPIIGFINKGKGLVVLSGCAHAGIVNTVRYAQECTGCDRLHAVMGGFHLTGPQFEPVIRPTLDALKALGPDYVIPTHCTGRGAVLQFEREMPRQFLLNMSGTRIIFA